MGKYSRFLSASAMVCSLAIAVPAWAGEKIIYQDAPDWVQPKDINAVLEAERSPDAMFVILDKQVRLENGIVETYSDIAFRAVSAEALSTVGKLAKANWQPEQGDLIIHGLQIIRGDQVINPFDNGFELEVIRREKNLEQQELNGVLTATSQLEDLQIGDIVRFTRTTTRSNPALDGHVQHSSKFISSSLAEWDNSFRVIWPKSEKLQWKSSIDDHPIEQSVSGDYNVLTMALSKKKEDELPKDSPNRYRLSEFFDATSFRSWEDVSSATAKLYRTDGMIADGSDLASEVSKIAQRTTNPMERTALALQLVQDKVRYLYNGLGFGNYSPQSPEETWQLRYGDCKAKTFLLLSILHELGISAEPALVNTVLEDGTAERLPAFQAFNHILVRATINGQILWLDGTSSGARLDDLTSVPDHRYALPVRDKGADLEEIAIRPIGRPFHNVKIRYDMSAGTAFPAVYDMEVVIRNSAAYNLKNSRTQLTEDKFQEALDKEAKEYVVGNLISQSNYSFDEERGEGVIKARGVTYLDWKTRLGKKRHSLWNILSAIKLDTDRSKPEWKDIPVKVSYPSFYQEQATFLLPVNAIEGEGEFTLFGKDQMAENIAGFRVNRNTEINGDILSFRESYYPAQWEIPADKIAIETKKLKAAKKKKITVVAPKGLMEDWRQFEVAKENGTLQLVKDEFDRLVAHDPEEKEVYEERAYFYQIIGDYDAAIADLDRSLAIEADADVHNWKSELLAGFDNKLAIAEAEKALAMDPAHSSAVSGLVDIYANIRKADKAKKSIAASRAQGLADEKADRLLAIVLQSEGKQNEADELLSRLIEDDPESLSLLNERCWLRGRGNFKLEEALDDCTEAVELAKNPSTYLDSRALIYYRLGMYDDALADLNRALRLNPKLSSSRYLRAMVHEAKGNQEAAENDHRAAVYLFKYVHLTYDRFGLGVGKTPGSQTGS